MVERVLVGCLGVQALVERVLVCSLGEQALVDSIVLTVEHHSVCSRVILIVLSNLKERE